MFICFPQFCTCDMSKKSTDISKYFRGSLRLRDNESRLYIEDLDLALKVSAVIALAFLSEDRIAGVLYNAERVLRYIGVFCKDLHSWVQGGQS